MVDLNAKLPINKRYNILFALGTKDKGISLSADCIQRYSLNRVIAVALITIINQNTNVDGNEPT
ncbi:hypothetical protein BpHYR1_022200 [Brachionus plicatilis]|uniref:Uncharacterized protein n=1 Tax=Brachionus plicatilis TaxID=10195 RepID=A0A3M7SA26_BRAPC|nr:hypothetical protein BpHYR1_022200 [Brachionus plicatilis]